MTGVVPQVVLFWVAFIVIFNISDFAPNFTAMIYFCFLGYRVGCISVVNETLSVWPKVDEIFIGDNLMF